MDYMIFKTYTVLGISNSEAMDRAGGMVDKKPELYITETFKILPIGLLSDVD